MEEQQPSYHMKPCQVFRDNRALINSADFHRCGALLAVSSDDSCVNIYNALEPTLLRTLKTDAKLVRYTLMENEIVTTPTYRFDTSIRQIDIVENKILHIYKGHRDTIHSISVDPISPVFITSAADSITCFWDFRTPRELYRINPGVAPVSSISRDGSHIAIVTQTTDSKKYRWSSNKRTSCRVGPVGFDVTLYDPRILAKPLDSLTLSMPVNALGSSVEDCVSMKFSNSGMNILITTNTHSLYLVNSHFDMEVPVKRLTDDRLINEGNVLQADFTYDDKFVVCGSDGDGIFVWDTSSEYSLSHCTDVIDIKRGHSSVITYNPIYKMMALAGTDLSLWLPRKDQEFGMDPMDSMDQDASMNGMDPMNQMNPGIPLNQMISINPLDQMNPINTMNPMNPTSTMNPMNTMNPLNPMNPMNQMNTTINQMNPMNQTNPMNIMNPMNQTNPTNIMNTMNPTIPINQMNPMNPTNSINPMNPANQMNQMNPMNSMSQMGQMVQMVQIGQLGQTNQM